MTGWYETADGEWIWPLHPARQEDHLRVWRIPRTEAGRQLVAKAVEDRLSGWHGVLMFDGTSHTTIRVGPCQSADEAKRALVIQATLYIARLADSLR